MTPPPVESEAPSEQDASDSLKINLGQISQQGRRELNEDAYAFINPTINNVQLYKGACAMIADGTGGDGSGRDASHFLQTKLFEEYYSTPDSWTVERSVLEAVSNLNRWLYDRRGSGKSYLSTLSMMVLRGRTFQIVHVGDTRVYLWRGGALSRLTQDHHYPGDAARLVRAMGLDSVVKPDFYSDVLEPGDVFIMTTDGVHGDLQDEHILDMCQRGLSAQGLANELCKMGLDLGHGDNSTVQVLQVDELPLPSRSEMIAEEAHLTAAPELKTGEEIDGYRIKGRLGSGGMATLYLAEEIDSGLEVAIKCPNPELLNSPVQLERFHREEWTGLRLHSPYLLRMYPPKPRRTKYYYIVMEYCHGKSLRHRLDIDPKFSTDYVMSIAYQLAKGLHFMHNLDIVHRDIKPENVIVSDEGACKIVDYGIVRLPSLSQLNSKDEVKSLIGSPYYMGPEFFNEGSRGSVQTDIYALGVLMYELLSGGHFPYGKIDDLDYENETPPYKSLKFHREDLPDWIDHLIRKAVHWNPDRRFGALSELLFAIDHPGEITLEEERQPLMLRRPLAFWKWITFTQTVVILMLLYVLIVKS